MSKQTYFVGFVICLLVILFYRLPYIIFIPVPYISPDTFDHFGLLYPHLVDQIFGPCYLPAVFDKILWVYDRWLSAPEQLVLAQQLFTLAVFIVSAWILFRLLGYYSILPLIGVAIYLIDPGTAALDIALIPDSTYRNTTILLSLLIAIAVIHPDWKTYISISVLVVFLAMFRSNGIYLYFLLVLFAYIAYKQERIRHYLLYMLTPFLLFNLAWSAHNLKLCGVFLPSDPGMFIHVNENFHEHKEEEKMAKLKLGRWFIGNITNYQFRSFYYTIIPDTYYRYTQYLSNPGEAMYNNAITIPDTLKKLVLKQMVAYTLDDNPYAKTIHQVDDVLNPGNRWIHLAGALEMLHSAFFKNWLVFLLFIAGFIFALFNIVRSKHSLNWSYIYISIAGIYLASLISLSFVAWHITRYIQVAEFAVYLCIGLIPVLWAEQRGKLPR